MSTRRELVVGGAAVALAGVAAREVAAQGQAMKAKTEIIALSKLAVQGQEQVVASKVVQCPDGHRTRTIDFRVRAIWTPTPCDEDCSKEFINGTWDATATVIRRENPELGLSHRGCFTGKWQLRNSANIVVAAGTWAGTVVAGTHNFNAGTPDCEPCDPRLHFEGVLDGQANAQACKGKICASIQGTGLDPELPTFQMRVEGALFRPCHQAVPG